MKFYCLIAPLFLFQILTSLSESKPQNTLEGHHSNDTTSAPTMSGSGGGTTSMSRKTNGHKSIQSIQPSIHKKEPLSRISSAGPLGLQIATDEDVIEGGHIVDLYLLRDENRDGVPDGWSTNKPNLIKFINENKREVIISPAKEAEGFYLNTFLEVFANRNYELSFELLGNNPIVTLTEFAKDNTILRSVQLKTVLGVNDRINLSTFTTSVFTQRVLLSFSWSELAESKLIDLQVKSLTGRKGGR